MEQDEEWIVAYCPEIPGANGQGRTKLEALDSLIQPLILHGGAGSTGSNSASIVLASPVS